MEVCVQNMVVKNKFWFKFKNGQMIEMIHCLILLVCSKEEVGQGVNETIYDLPKKGEGEFLTIEDRFHTSLINTIPFSGTY